MTKIVESIIRNENAVVTASCLLQDYHGVSDICLSVPLILNRKGIEQIIKLPLSDNEIPDFQKSAAIVKKVADSLNI